MPKFKLLASTVAFDADAACQFEEIIPDAQFADEAGVTDRTTREWREKGIGPDYVKIGKSIFYRRSAIAAWIERRTVRHRPAQIAGHGAKRARCAPNLAA